MDAIGLHFFDCFYQCSLALKKNGAPLYSDRDRKILMETYGLADSEIHTFTEIAQEYGLSRERIRQLHVKIFKRMGFLRRNNYPAIVEIDNHISKNHSVSIECDEQFALYIEQFHKEHMPDFNLNLLLRLLSFYLYKNSESVDKWETIICQNRQNNRRKQKAQRKILKLNTRLEKLIGSIIWFDTPKIWSEAEMKNYLSVRQLNSDTERNRSKQGEFFSQKLNRNVFYESLLEKQFYGFLEECPDVIHYTEQAE
ncbi:sigma factor-like helix-turn-helix DNA-binding protein [Rikenella microfusus]|uniref:RNA polymerase sigma factor n=1 Tax=Rikenella microfusus TaxID=28139 RepID=A0A379MQF1_9BACT|nr:sigma factor-like helix-turn-helix DNA-binding protein [Rikenella microfusus]SUE33871.1 RNA polymerase sigma factor [Rikenella microfusus]